MRVLSTHSPYQFSGTQTTVSVLHTGSTQLVAATPHKYLLIQSLDPTERILAHLGG